MTYDEIRKNPEVKALLERVGFEVDLTDGTVTVPSFRSDVENKYDLSEEVARFYGYDNIPCTLVNGETTQGGYTPEQKMEQHLGATCRTMGYNEIITYSFISPTYYDKIRWPQDAARRESFKILNPLGEDTSIMRTTVLPSMLEILTRNYNYRNKNVKLYEVGRIYLPGNGGLLTTIAMMCAGWDGCKTDNNPGFPQDGTWNVKWEGFQRMQ